jgi:glutathione-regulated potassium-efflux system ancillary protein KefF
MVEALRMILVIYAHPYPARSRACAALLSAIREREGLEVRSLYDLYPDFDIDGDAERAAVERAKLVVFLHPLYWYSMPALLKHWLDHVFIRGWSHGEGGGALAGKDFLWVTTSGGGDEAFTPGGRHGHPFDAFETPIEQTARYVGMNWLEPFAVHGAHVVPSEALREAGAKLRARLDDWSANGKH